MVFTLDVIIRAQSTIFFLCIGPFWHETWNKWTNKHTNTQTNKQTNNQVILVQACSWPVRSHVFCNSQSPSHFLNSYLDLGFCYCICQLIQHIYKYWDANAVWFKSSHPLGLEECSLRGWASNIATFLPYMCTLFAELLSTEGFVVEPTCLLYFFKII